MNYTTNNGVVVTPSRKFHEHSQITENLLKGAISSESEAIEDAFKKGEKVSITHSFPFSHVRFPVLQTQFSADDVGEVALLQHLRNLV